MWCYRKCRRVEVYRSVSVTELQEYPSIVERASKVEISEDSNPNLNFVKPNSDTNTELPSRNAYTHMKQ